ncbi:MAG: 3-hydroxyacyl-CoA dehydrogenase family protein [Solirubrobacterales bacterium]|nr:3-hydroxyacyl-CoA dehydrogenase family protein [Solirubrobacterales bacterium]
MDEQLGIAGSGAIACGVAVSAARHGDVVLWARSDDSAQRAGAAVEKICARLDDEASARRVRVETDLQALGEATFVVEAIVEETAAKSALLADLHGVAAPAAVLATTTSSLSVADLARASGRAERFVGLHVFNPVPRMKLVELAFPAAASTETRERSVALCRALGKEPVEVPDRAGFVVNRLLFPYLFEAVRFMEETGMAPEAVDTCMQLGAGHPMGPIALLDYVGLDVAAAIGDAIGADVPERLRDLVDEGALGRKSGRGLYPPAGEPDADRGA